jgi:excisionase family DNA binding protein
LSREKLLTIKEARKRLGLSRQTFYRLREAGKLKYYQVGRAVRISEKHIADYLESIEQPKKPKKARA